MRGILVLFFLVFLTITAKAQNGTSPEIDTATISCKCGHKVDKIPEFPGGEQGFEAFIKKNLKQQANKHDNGRGRVIAAFFIETDGRITNIRIIRGVSSEKDKEVVRLMKKSPRWKPAINNGKPERFEYFIPISFK
ncbi:energy transducer TonB [Mucilaginibacter celer]|uniref:Energy transducer TonB n=1 Tax=Mucilaginibacter celer TaxID=2305508 RepID=A0A494VPS9_9SPHI|nr:energy transducer TonB [Mucilaginibacter celer]AYL95871.1 energy transducer TonB [Mucilaginibacter celer]